MQSQPRIRGDVDLLRGRAIQSFRKLWPQTDELERCNEVDALLAWLIERS